MADESEDLRVAALQRQLVAREKTIRVLMDRVEGRLDVVGSSFAVFQESIALERLVERRTHELKEANRKLDETLSRLQHTQEEAAAAQRWAAVGTLAAGVAHEINTPVQFVSDSVQFLRDSMADVLTLLETRATVQAILARGGSLADVEEALVAVKATEDSVDLAYVREHAPRAFERCIEGLARVGLIVRSLNEFAHPAGAQMVPADLNRAIQTTLTIAAGELRYVADLETDFTALALVPCYVNDISQVILNLVVNAAHAIGEVVRGTEKRGTIRVATRQDGDEVVVTVSDTGQGIEEAIRHRIFEPFFTTKEVGQGTGQGLALAWAVITEKHGGRITVDSTVGRGSTFTIRLKTVASCAAAE